ncbi:MAG: thioredoxin [Muribaculaceae bacterium]|nr:thioredoxin [Muribaculaceae bacterium]
MKRFDEIIGESRPTLVDFYATWCGPCRRQMPILEDVKDKMRDKINLLKIDIEQNQELTDRYRIQSVPTIMIFKNGEIMWRASGIQSLADIMMALNKAEWR